MEKMSDLLINFFENLKSNNRNLDEINKIINNVKEKENENNRSKDFKY